MLNKIYNTLLMSFCLYMCFSVTHEAKSIDTQFVPYYNKFIDIRNQCDIKTNENLRIEMSEKIKPDWIAVCYYFENIILVNKQTWNRLSNSEKEQTMFHEMGHCLLNQFHDDKNLNLMNSKGFIRLDNYKHYYNYFIRRLFKDCKKPLYQQFEYEEVN